jgi:hypothetical protein
MREPVKSEPMRGPPETWRWKDDVVLRESADHLSWWDRWLYRKQLDMICRIIREDRPDTIDELLIALHPARWSDGARVLLLLTSHRLITLWAGEPGRFSEFPSSRMTDFAMLGAHFLVVNAINAEGVATRTEYIVHGRYYLDALALATAGHVACRDRLWDNGRAIMEAMERENVQV